jgi:hypothetical protein
MECEEKDSGDGHLRSSQFPHLSCFKEFDLLLLSETEIDTKNIKKMASSAYLKEVQESPSMFMAIVHKKRALDKTFI